jgi:iron complex outermembrane recepter protein
MHSTRVGLFIFSVALFGFAPLGTGWAQSQTNPLKGLSLEQLSNIEVTTQSKEPEQLWSTPAAVYVISQEDIRRSGYTDIPDLLRLAPGVEVSRIDSRQWAVGIRGFGDQFSKSVLVLIDGRSVYTPFFAGVLWDIQNVLLEDIDRIEVIRGPGGTVWGSNAVNGVINIITKSASDTHGGLVSLASGNFEHGTGEFRYGGSRGKMDYRAYGLAFARGEEFHPGPAQRDGWELGQAGFRADWKLAGQNANIDGANPDSVQNSFTLQGDLFNGYAEHRVPVTSFEPPSVTNVDDTQPQSGGNLMARWRHVISNTSDILVQSYFDRTSLRSVQFMETRNTYDLDLSYRTSIDKRNTAIVGAGLRESQSNTPQATRSVNFLPNSELDYIYSVFAQDQWQIVPKRLSVIAGSKFDYNNFVGWEVQPSGRLLWTPGTRQTLWAAVTRAVRTPSRFDQDIEVDFLSSAGPPPAFLGITGTKSFTTEKNLAYEVGYRRLLTEKLFFDVSAFFTRYRDLNIISAPQAAVLLTTPPPTRIFLDLPFVNGMNARTSGFEIAPEWRPTDAWRLKGSYSYLYLRAKDKPGFTDIGTALQTTGSSPTHRVVLQSTLNLPKHFEFDQVYRYTSQMPAQAAGVYNAVDARIGWHPNDRFEFSLMGQDLTRPYHAEFLGGEPGGIVLIRRSMYAKIVWRR